MGSNISQASVTMKNLNEIVNDGDSSLATELQGESEENSSPAVDENNIVSAKKQGPSTHNWSGDWTFWISSSTYKDRNEEYRQQFTHLPDSEKLIAGNSADKQTRRDRRQRGERA